MVRVLHLFVKSPALPSSVISFFHYDPTSLVLKIGFVSGRVYEYVEVPETLFKKMRGALSKGKFFNKYIKDRFVFNQLR